MAGAINLAKVTSKGQVTIPVEIRKALGIKTGDKLLFSSNADGSVTLRNATIQAFDDLTTAFEGAAEQAGLSGEQDVVDMIKAMRKKSSGA